MFKYIKPCLKRQKFLPALDSSGKERWYELWLNVMVGILEVSVKVTLLT